MAVPSRSGSHSPLPLVILAWSCAQLGLGMALAVILRPTTSSTSDPYFMVVFTVMVTGLTTMGALIASQRPRNPIGWLLLSAALLIGASIMGGTYAELSVTRYDTGLPLTTFFAWITGWTFAPAIGIVVIIVPLLFPTGRLPSPRWRLVLVPAIIGPLAGGAPAAFNPGPLDVPGHIINPVGIPGAAPLLTIVNMVSIATLAPALLAVIISLVLRYRRGRADERDQIKWFAYPASVAAVALAIGLADAGPISDVGWVVALSAIALLPVAIAIAILRRRLFDIDVIINRTLVYGVLSVVLAGIYVVSVLLLQELLNPLAANNGLAVAASTLGVAALFQPLRRRIQAVVDRRFYRSRYDAARVVTAFTGRLREEVELDHLTDELRGSISEALRPTSVSVWLRRPAAER